MARTSRNGAFQFSLDLHSGVPVYRQLIDQVRGGVASGSLVAGDQLPTVRQLAVDLAINPNTVMRAYRELELEDFWKHTKAPAPLSAIKSRKRTLPGANVNSTRWPVNLRAEREPPDSPWKT